jgi:hypothetical protein
LVLSQMSESSILSTLARTFLHKRFTFAEIRDIISLSVIKLGANMKYYIIYLACGKVIDIASWDDEAGRDLQAAKDTNLMYDYTGHGTLFDQVQVLNVVK